MIRRYKLEQREKSKHFIILVYLELNKLAYIFILFYYYDVAADILLSAINLYI